METTDPAPPALDAILRLIRAGEREAVVQFFAGMDERERATLAPGVYATFRRLERGEYVELERPDWQERVQKALEIRPQWRFEQGPHAAAALAVLGCCPLRQTRRIAGHWVGRPDSPALAVLRDRRPGWLAAWLAHHLDGGPFPGIGWEGVEALVAAGLCERPDSPGYTRLMADGLGWRWEDGKAGFDLERALRAEPLWLESRVWRLFEHETGAFDALRPDPRRVTGPDGNPWHEALVVLSAEALVDRPRLLSATLEAMWVYERASALSGLCGLHQALEPSPAERAALAGRYLDLLRHRRGTVVALALAAGKGLVDSGVVREDEYLRRLVPVFDLPAARQPLAGLRQVARLLKREPALLEVALPLLEAALRHARSDVQARALDVIRDYQAGAPEAVTALLQRCEGDLPASLRPSSMGEDPSVVVTSIGSSPFPTAADHGAPDEPPVPLCPGSVETVEELVELAGRLIERVDAFGEVERLLDGISRLADQRPPDFHLRTESLRARLKRRHRDSSLAHGVVGFAAPSGFAVLLHAWLTPRERVLRLPAAFCFRGPTWVLNARLLELAGRVRRGRAAPLLATPTHEGGWVDASVLVARLQALERCRLRIPPMDFQQALLRLQPLGRAEALGPGGALGGWAGRVLRFALGDAVVPGPEDRSQGPCWVAAALARAPDGAAAGDLRALGLPARWPGLRGPAGIDWRSRPESAALAGRRVGPRSLLDLRLAPPYPRYWLPVERRFEYRFSLGDHLRGLARDLASIVDSGGRLFAQIRERVRSGQLHGIDAFLTVKVYQVDPALVREPWLTENASWCLPRQPRAFHLQGISRLALSLDFAGSRSLQLAPFLVALTASHRPRPDEPALLLLALGLIARDMDCRRAAVDACSLLLEERGVDPRGLASVLRRLAEGSGLKPQRLSAALDAVRSASETAAAAVRVVLLDWFCGRADIGSADLPLMALLLECLAGATATLPAELVPVFEGVRGKGKTAEVARRLLACAARGSSPHRVAPDTGLPAAGATPDRALALTPAGASFHRPP